MGRDTGLLFSSVLQPNLPRAVIKKALESANKTRSVMFPVFIFLVSVNDYFGIQLARRLFYSFAEKESEYLLVEDIESFFSTKEEADRVFALFDKDSNGDVSREEMDTACL